MFKIGFRFGTLFLAAYLLFVGVSPVQVSGQEKRSPVAPNRERVEAAVREAYDKYRSDTNGKNADYIPYLAQVDSKLFGVAVVTRDNQVFELGDVKYSFSIQSISKLTISINHGIKNIHLINKKFQHLILVLSLIQLEHYQHQSQVMKKYD